jgi:hypothetical protein
MKVLMLVISSHNQPVYDQHKQVWRSYMKSHPDIECYFIEYLPTTFSPVLMSDTLYLRGIETYKNITRKTIQALEYFLKRKSYDYVVRTNLSSVWKFPKLIDYLQTAPKTKLYAGVVCTNHPPLKYISGAGILFSIDVCFTLLQKRDIAYLCNKNDDVDFGVALSFTDIVPTPVPRVDVHSYEDIYKEAFHYRVRFWENREREPNIMRAILSS